MIKVGCPFKFEFNTIIRCPYMDEQGICSDIEIGPGNGDAWCSNKIRAAIDMENVVDLETVDISKASVKLGTSVRQNYMCHVCGLKSFVTFNSTEDMFSVATKIGEDHHKREPTCPNPVGDINMVGEATEI